ncbi:MAG: ANTAR domain-containing response regulator [Bacillota bacterium]
MSERPLRILIAEDEAMNLLGFKSFLADIGHQVVGEAYDGVMAVELARELSPDLIIMDIKMPKMDGIKALEYINQDSERIIPCIFVTAFSDIQLINKAKDVGAFSYLIKPVNYESLMAAIEITMVRFNEYLELKKELITARTDLHNRKIIERAKGILMDEFYFKEQQAMEYLQKKSRNENKKIIEVAKEIIRMKEALLKNDKY